MDYLEGVEEAYADDDLLCDFGGVVLAEYLLLLDELEEVLAVDQLGDDVDVRLGLDALLELQQERVRHDLHDAALVAEWDGRYAMRFLVSGSSLKVAISLIAYSLFSLMCRQRYTTENLPVPILPPISYFFSTDSPL